jgi:hypothetical protein
VQSSDIWLTQEREKRKVGRFYLDPEYQNFETGEVGLKLKTFAPLAGDLFNILIVPLVFGWIALLFGYALLVGIWRDIDYQFNGTDAVATIIHCERIRKEGKTDYWELELNFTYDTPNGRLQGVETFTDNRQCVDLPTEVAMQFLSYYPSQARITDAELAPEPLLKLADYIIMGGGIILGFYGFTFQMRENWLLIGALTKRPRLQAKGVLLEGELIQIERHIHIRTHYLIAEYRFTSPTGVERQGKQMAEREDLRGKNLPLAGAPVTVLYADDQTYVML